MAIIDGTEVVSAVYGDSIITEAWESRDSTIGRNNSHETRTYLIEVTDVPATSTPELAARFAMEWEGGGGDPPVVPTELPVMGLYRDSISIERLSEVLFRGVARYGPVNEDDSIWTFDTSGGNQHITQSIATVAQHGASGTPPNHYGAIGVTGDSVDGVDIVVPIYHFSETHYKSNASVDSDYKQTLFGLTGKVNDAAFKDFDAGEVLFMGATGSRRENNKWELTYRFAASRNRTGITIGTITGIAKKGWEYLWVSYKDTHDYTADRIAKVPMAVYVEQVYENGDFSELAI